jgi:hypothetical protein
VPAPRPHDAAKLSALKKLYNRRAIVHKCCTAVSV